MWNRLIRTERIGYFTTPKWVNKKKCKALVVIEKYGRPYVNLISNKLTNENFYRITINGMFYKNCSTYGEAHRHAMYLINGKRLPKKDVLRKINNYRL